MKPEIIYKSIKHGYVRIQKDGSLQICIPSFLRGNQTFLDQLLEKGQKLLQRYAKKQKVQSITQDNVLVFGEQVAIQDVVVNPKKLSGELKQILYDYAKPILDGYSQKLGKPHKELTIRKARSKWGSCTIDQRIMLNASLIHLPTRLIIYVIIHEACHLKVKDHSPNFRKTVEIYCPNYKILRKELKSFILD